MSSTTAATQHHRLWRRATIFPAVATAVLGTIAVAVIGAATPSAAAPSPSHAPSSDATPSQPASGHTPSTFADHKPVGAVPVVHKILGGLHIGGWDIDWDDRTAPLTTYVRMDGGKSIAHMSSDIPRAGVAKEYPSAGADHGFSFDLRIPEGTHTVCVGADNVGQGSDTRLGCYTRTYDYGPKGDIDLAETVPGALHVVGWAIDNDAPTDPVTMDISVDGTVTTATADKKRPDVAKANPGAGPDHGYDVTIPASQGKHTVCVTAVNIGIGSDNSFGCKTLTLHDSPYGHLDSVTYSDGKVYVRGWTYDPDRPQAPLDVTLSVNGHDQQTPLVADKKRTDVAKAHPEAGPDHGFAAAFPLRQGKRTVCAVAKNVGIGSKTTLGCKTLTLSYTPTSGLTALLATRTGASVSGWAVDPDTTDPINAQITVDGTVVDTVSADGDGSNHDGHAFVQKIPMKSGKHTVCVVGVNVDYGTSNSKPACRTITLALGPLGVFTGLTRVKGSNDLEVSGWTFDPDSPHHALKVAVTMGGKPNTTLTANTVRDGIAQIFPQVGKHHGFDATIDTNGGEHNVCLTALNVGGGKNLSLGCKLVIAVNPTVSAAPPNVSATPTFDGAVVSWKAPKNDGGAPPSKYIVTAHPSGKSVTVPSNQTTATIHGLRPNKKYTFSVTAVNVAGTSKAGVSPTMKTIATPPPQRTPAPVSTSRYIRNVHGASKAEQAMMRREGAADATANPSGHRYLILLDIGGQDQYDGGVVLTATTTFVSYQDLVTDVKAYVAGYHSAQRNSAPVMIALGTNNDMDVSASTGADWASKVVNPIRKFAGKYSNMVIAGANDIEPGFRATYSQTRSWLGGFLGATKAQFVFNGSADGCAWTVPNGGCNNGWNMNGLYALAAGAAPTRIINLPQIYNNTMAAQWKYISLTGLSHKDPRINFGGVLTEWTACAQAQNCGSLTGHSAWSVMWNLLQTDKQLKVRSLPYSTDLRIDR